MLTIKITIQTWTDWFTFLEYRPPFLWFGKRFSELVFLAAVSHSEGHTETKNSHLTLRSRPREQTGLLSIAQLKWFSIYFSMPCTNI